MTHASARFATIALALAMLVPEPIRADAPASRAIDVTHSQARFAVSHLYLAHVNGSVPVVSGTIVLSAPSALPISITAILDPRHIDTGDADRDAELPGPDWFDTKRFPTWTFASTSVVPRSSTAFTLTGSLTVHGVAQTVALTVTIVAGLPNPHYIATGPADRHAFGMHVTPTDSLVGNDIEITLDIRTQPPV